MQYFTFLLCSLWLLTIFILFAAILLQRKFIRKACINNIVASALINYPLFSSLAVQEITKRILKKNHQQQKELLRYISCKNFSQLINKNEDKQLCTLLKVITKNANPRTIDNRNFSLSALCTQLAINRNNYIRATAILKKIDDSQSHKIYAATKLLLEAQIAFHEGDLLNASVWTIQAAVIYKKKHYLYEEAQSYLLLGHIYTVANELDSAYFMFRNANKIFSQLNSPYKITETLVALAELTAMQNRFEEAEAFLRDSHNQANLLANKEILHFVICRQAMLNITNNQHQAALQILRTIPLKKCTENIKKMVMEISAQANLKL